MPRAPRFYTQADLFQISVESGITTTEIRFITDAATALRLGEAVSSEVGDHVRDWEVSPPPAESRGYIVRFHLDDLENHPDPPPSYEVVEAAARRHLRIEHIIFYGLQTLLRGWQPRPRFCNMERG